MEDFFGFLSELDTTQLNKREKERRRARNRINRDMKIRKKQESILSYEGFIGPYYYKEKEVTRKDGTVDTVKYIKRARRPRMSKFYKREANKAVRKYEKSISKGGCYRKIGEYWYNLY